MNKHLMSSQKEGTKAALMQYDINSAGLPPVQYQINGDYTINECTISPLLKSDINSNSSQNGHVHSFNNPKRVLTNQN